MKLSVEIPDEWSAPLRKAASDAGYKSVSDYIRNFVATQIGVAPLNKSWGGSRTLVAALPDGDGDAPTKPKAHQPDIRDFNNAFDLDDDGDVRYEDPEIPA